MRTQYRHLILIACGSLLVAACEEERPPRSVSEFLENPILLEAAMVRCAEDRSGTRYDAECVNARQAVAQIAAKEEAARRAELERRSESKRQALRRTQQAAMEARRRAAEAEALRKEAEYLAQFGVVPPPEGAASGDEAAAANTPQAVIPQSDEPRGGLPGNADTVPATDGGNSPVVEVEPQPADTGTDLESIRDELQRRNRDADNPDDR